MNAIIRYRDPSGAVYVAECADRWASTLTERRLKEGAVSALATLTTGDTVEVGQRDPALMTDEPCAAVDYHWSAT